MSTLLQECDVAGTLKLLRDFRRMSLLDYSRNALAAAAPSANCAWQRTSKGEGIFIPQAPAGNIQAPVSVSLDATQFTVFMAGARQMLQGANYCGLWVRGNYAGWNFDPAGLMYCYDYGGAAVRNSTYTVVTNGRFHLFSMSINSGVVNGSSFYVDGTNYGNFTLTVVGGVGQWSMGYSGVNDGFGGPCVEAGYINRVLTPAEHARLYTDWQSEIILPAPPNRITYSYPSKRASEYTAAGIVLDTDFGSEVSAGTRRVREFTGAWPGVITGVLTPGRNNEGSRFTDNASTINHGDVTALNSVAAFTYETVIDTGPGNIPALSYIFAKGPADSIYLSNTAAAAAVQSLTLTWVVGAATFTATTTATQWRTGTMQHIAIVFDGSLTGDANRLKMFVDGEQVALTFAGAGLPVPATTPNLAGASLIYGNPGAAVALDAKQERLFNRALTAAQLRAEYLSMMRRVVWMYSGEDVPVSLVASVPAGQHIGRWLIDSGTHKVSESSNGRRWIEVVTGGNVSIPQPFVTGTYTVQFSKNLSNFEWMPFASVRGRFNVSASQNGYLVVVDGVGVLSLYRITAGALVGASRFSTVAGYVADNVEYHLALARRSSDGQFTLWIKGGAYADWTLVSTVGGFGTNPYVDATYFSSGFMNVQGGNAGSKFLIYDPRASGIVGEYL